MNRSEDTGSSFQIIISDAHLLRQQGALLDAWERLEDLKPIDRAEPETLALRLQLCADLERWELGENILGVLAYAVDETHKITCAEFLHVYARRLVSDGEIGKAKAAVKHAFELWQPIRVELIDDDGRCCSSIWIFTSRCLPISVWNNVPVSLESPDNHGKRDDT